MDLNDGKVEFTFGEHGLAVRDIKYTADCTTLITCSEDRHINIIDLVKMQIAQTLSNNKSWVTSLALHPTMNMFASGSADHTINIWDTKERKSLQTIKGY